MVRNLCSDPNMIDAWNRNYPLTVPFSIQLHLIALCYNHAWIFQCCYPSPQAPPTSMLHLSHVKILPTSKWHHSSVPVVAESRTITASRKNKWVKIWLTCEIRTIIACTLMCLADLSEGSGQEVVNYMSPIGAFTTRIKIDANLTFEPP